MGKISFKGPFPEGKKDREFLDEIFSRLDIEVTKRPSLKAFLFWDKGRLLLQIPKLEEKGLRPLYFDWNKKWAYHRRQNYKLRSEPLYKALGLTKNKQMTIVDATCGAGSDSLLILSFGASVRAFERNPIVSSLIFDAIRNASLKDDFSLNLKKNFSFRPFDPRKCNLLTKENPSVIYYDPMYPKDNKRTAFKKKEMQFFEEIIENDLDYEDFFSWARQLASNRVVVKRPLRGTFLSPNPSFSISGKSTRYDVYLS